MRVKSIVFGSCAVLASLTAAAAAPPAATSEQADAVRTAIERYVGHGDGGTGPVTVTPMVDHYGVAIDVKAALRVLERFGVTIDPASYTFTVAPTDAGLWHVTDFGVPKLTVRYGDQSYSVVANGTNFDGLFDPRLLGFQSSTLTYDSMSVATLGPKSDMQTREIKRGRQTTMTTPAGDGAVTVQMSQSSDGFVQEVDAAAIDASHGSPATVTIRSASTSGSVSVEEMHNRALADLWAFFVAHPSDTAIKAAQEDLRGILRQALPLFDRLVQSGETGKTTVDSPYGSFAADAVGGRVNLTGLVAQGSVESEVHVAGLAIPSGLVPGWADGLLPTSASIAERFTGFHLDAAARQAVDSFDLTAKDPLKPDVLEGMKTSLGPLDQMVVTLLPSRLASRLLNVDFDGEVHLRDTTPDFRVNIRASGLDATLQDLQGKSAADPTASQVVAVLVLAKGLGKAGADGKLSWTVTRNAAGEITVNGLTLPGAPRK